MKIPFGLRRLSLGMALAAAGLQAQAQVNISEIHYDNSGADTGEAIEIAGPLGTDVTGWSLVLYNGSSSSGKPYKTHTFSGALASSADCDGEGYAVAEIAGIQNGSPDGIALVDAAGVLVSFISYEGAFVGVTGPADGVMSTDIGVAETSGTPAGFSLSRTGSSWSGPAESHFGTCANPVAEEPAPLMKIHQVQGAGDSVTLSTPVQIEGIVVGDYQRSDQLRAFFVQEEDADADADPATSEGIYVYCGNRCDVDVSVGDLVRVTGTPKEYYGMSQLNVGRSSDVELVSTAQALPTPVEMTLPVPVSATNLDDAQAEIDAYYEAREGMLVRWTKPLSVVAHFNLGRYGTMQLADERLYQFTHLQPPSAEGFEAHQIATAARTLMLDDGSGMQNPEPTPYPMPGLSGDNYLRAGDTLANLTGPLHYSFSNWTVQPVPEQFSYDFVASNPRTEAPQPWRDSLTVASFNLLNYFTTLDLGPDVCGPDANMGCRGADNTDELARQQAKLVAALCEMDADIVGLIELENPNLGSVGETPLDTLVNAVNAACGGYASVHTGTLGTDAATVGIMYKPSSAMLEGAHAVLDTPDYVDPMNTGRGKHRPMLAQTFRDLRTGKVFTLAMAHLKAKSSSCGEGDDDVARGQGTCNGTRTAAVEVALDWLKGRPTGTVSPHLLVMGDLNAYRYEDPIMAFMREGILDLSRRFGNEAYSYTYDGQLGYLDHALGSRSIQPFVRRVHYWHINADELPLFDYNGEYKPDNYLVSLYGDHAYRASDHDPVIVELYFRGRFPPGHDPRTEKGKAGKR
ncbi:ExeM/NucH family extracellular endonuclease [Simiduia aestuariiviva]|uniref:Endonuclease/exonuclease/phosphatase domain-containing protein n=1 Tax=Simiduia aestuariiviva TaxID=1510459 RepID=A0A839USR3_9GAMM|nr:ExeM/NucH family extracellular endonuclease [Simiduia aestuariiviva]MBB3169479.1 hypothetical protein [Simiduia aestuariiviva]